MSPRWFVPLLLACLLAALPNRAHAASPGVNVIDDISAPAIQRALDTGAHEVRLFVPWAGLEPDHANQFQGNTLTDSSSSNIARAILAAVAQVKAQGRRVRVVITGAPRWANGGQSSNYPPTPDHVADFASFAARFVSDAKSLGSPIDALEVWNEPDGGEFWLPGPDPAAYTNLLEQTYAAVKNADPNVEVDNGPLTGNDYAWLEQLYAQGAQGSFDGVAVHTDTACLTAAPSDYYRDSAQGNRLGQFTFLGYREVRATMLAHGDDKPINMSELGWNATSGGPTSCDHGQWAGQKPSGVDPATQAQYLTQAFQCMANDPYVKTADWFSMTDGPAGGDNVYGLLTNGLGAKPSLAAFKTVAASDGGAAADCGDFSPPNIAVGAPAPNQKYAGVLSVGASAVDSGSGLGRITFQVDQDPKLKINFSALNVKGFANNTPVSYNFTGTKNLAMGAHTVTITAVDMLGNTSTRQITVTKVPESQLGKGTTKTTVRLSKPSCHARTCAVSGTALTKAGNALTAGKVRVSWMFRNKKGRYVALHKGMANANKPFSFRQKLARGAWRVKVDLVPSYPYLASSSRTYGVR